MMDKLLDVEVMEKYIRGRRNLSAPGVDELTFPILKIEPATAARLCIEIMKTTLKKGRCPETWKSGKTIMISKGGDTNNPANWRPITLTSIIYRTYLEELQKNL
jgi:hypothetical protein